MRLREVRLSGGGSVIVWNASLRFAVAELRLDSARGGGGIALVVELGYLSRYRVRNWWMRELAMWGRVVRDVTGRLSR